jgi:gliding motility-associated lipoprotein GldH
MRKSLFLILLIPCFLSCSNSDEYILKMNFENNKWNKFKTVEFKLFLNKAVEYQSKIVIEYLPEYEYSDLKLQYEFICPDGESRLNYYTIPVVDSKGNKLGKPKNGHLIAERIISKNEISNSEGEYKILIDNFMPKFDTESILSISVEIKTI